MTALIGDELTPAMMENGEITMTSEKATPEFYQLQRAAHELGPHRLPSAARAALDVAGARRLDAPVGGLLAGDRDPRRDPSQLRAHPLRRRRKGARRTHRHLQSLGRAVRSRSQRHHLHEVAAPSSTRPRPGRAGPTAGRLPLAVLAAGRALSRLLRAAGHRSRRGEHAALRPRRRRSDRPARAPSVAGFSGGGSSVVEAELVFKREPHAMFDNLHAAHLRRPRRRRRWTPRTAIVHYPDLPMLATLLGANLRTGRFVDLMRKAHPGRALLRQRAADRSGGGDGRADRLADGLLRIRSCSAPRRSPPTARAARLAGAHPDDRRAAGRRAASRSSP